MISWVRATSFSGPSSSHVQGLCFLEPSAKSGSRKDCSALISRAEIIWALGSANGLAFVIPPPPPPPPPPERCVPLGRRPWPQSRRLNPILSRPSVLMAAVAIVAPVFLLRWRWLHFSLVVALKSCPWLLCSSWAREPSECARDFQQSQSRLRLL